MKTTEQIFNVILKSSMCNTWFSGRSSAVKLSEADAETVRMIERLRGLPHHDGTIDDSIVPEQFRPPQSESGWDGHEACVYNDGSKCIRISRSIANDVNKSFMLYESITELTDETAAHASLSFDSTAAYAIYCAILKLYPEFKKQHEKNGNIH